MRFRFAAALFAALAAPTFAADSGPLEPMDSPPAGASLPHLPDANDASEWFRSMQPRPLPRMPEPVFGDPLPRGPRPYWESDPLFIAPPWR